MSPRSSARTFASKRQQLCNVNTQNSYVCDDASQLRQPFVKNDCKPLAKKPHNPISGRAIDFAKTATYAFRSELLAELVCKRKVALRLGELADRKRWLIRAEPTQRLLNLDPLCAPIAPSLNEHIDGLRSRWPREPSPIISS